MKGTSSSDMLIYLKLGQRHHPDGLPSMLSTYSGCQRAIPNRNESSELHKDKEMRKDSLHLHMTNLILYSVLSHILVCLGSKLRVTFSHCESSHSP